MIPYFDTSAIDQLIIEEATSATRRRMWNDASRVASSRLLYPETRAALARAERLGRLTTSQLAAAVEELDALISQLDVIEIGPDIAHAGGELAQRFGLRGYDAMHLAAGLAASDDDVVFVTGDHDLAAAAEAAGMATALIAT